MIPLLIWMATLAVAGLSLYGALGWLTAWLYWRRGQGPAPAPPDGGDLPRVTVQLPVFNERHVVARLIRAAATLDYPSHLLQIQVLDDSTDDTTERAAALVAHFQRQGLDITLHHRQHRRGYKAGALAAAMPTATGDLIALFDADFVPPARFLRQTVPHFAHHPDLAAVQTRWRHLNADHSPLTAVQAIALDKHFAIEQRVRDRAGLWPKFNGSAGIWRRASIEAAGGWRADTLCEDLCLSLRTGLAQQRVLYLDDVATPAELPTGIQAYKNQQARWATGSLQCLRLYGPRIVAAGAHGRLARLYTLLTMSAYLTNLLLLLLLLLQVAVVAVGGALPSWLWLLGVLGAGQPILFVLSQRALYPHWRRHLRHLPLLLFMAIGLSPNGVRAMWQAVAARQRPFARTPKQGAGSPGATYPPTFDPIVLAELAAACTAAAGLALCLWRHNPGPAPFFLACLLGFALVSGLTLQELWAWRDAHPGPGRQARPGRSRQQVLPELMPDKISQRSP